MHTLGTFVRPYDEATKSFYPVENMRASIFLAGPCPRVIYSEDWRFEAVEILRKLGFQGNIISPTNEQYQEMRKQYADKGDEMLAMQTAWERNMMHQASALVFWVPRSEKWPAMTTNVEFGEWYKREGVLFGYPPGAIRNEYLDIKFKEQKKYVYHDLTELLSDAMSYVYRAQKKYFTADTHFYQQRTLELSRRPFRDVNEMNLMLISNWNKKVPENGIVYHAGDFMDPTQIDKLPTLLSNLNFGELHWVLGNYDRNVETAIRDVVAKMDRKVVLYTPEQPCHVDINGHKFRIVHEPNGFVYAEDDDVTYLYSHIHGRSFTKRNGFDVATDYHNFTPLSEDDVLWFKNAMPYWDENVYSDSVSSVASEAFTTTLHEVPTAMQWPDKAVEEFMKRPELKRMVFVGMPTDNEYPVLENNAEYAAGVVTSMQKDLRGKWLVTVRVEPKWPHGKTLAQLVHSKVPIGYLLCGMGTTSDGKTVGDDGIIIQLRVKII